VARFPAYTTTPPYGNHDGIGGSLLSFMQLVRQRTNGNQLQQALINFIQFKFISFSARAFIFQARTNALLMTRVTWLFPWKKPF
jgi:hypothetical protein